MHSLRQTFTQTTSKLDGHSIYTIEAKPFRITRVFDARGCHSLAQAGASDYQFELVSKARAAEITVRLVHKPDGTPVPDAVIFATRLDMSPDGMEDMSTPLTSVAGGEPGVYRFKARLSMAGGWALSLGAKVQGEPETVQGKLILKAQ